MAKAPPQRISLLLNQEIAAVVTAMRQNAKWAMVPTRYTVIAMLAMSQVWWHKCNQEHMHG